MKVKAKRVKLSGLGLKRALQHARRAYLSSQSQSLMSTKIPGRLHSQPTAPKVSAAGTTIGDVCRLIIGGGVRDCCGLPDCTLLGLHACMFQ
jgi:hypothetical protein